MPNIRLLQQEREDDKNRLVRVEAKLDQILELLTTQAETTAEQAVEEPAKTNTSRTSTKK